MRIHIVPNDKGNPPGKLADAELHFTEGPLEGLKLIGFGIWERRVTDIAPSSEGVRKNNRNVTFPARQYAVNGEWREFALLRPDCTPLGRLERGHQVDDLAGRLVDRGSLVGVRDSLGVARQALHHAPDGPRVAVLVRDDSLEPSC
jgi:hypothetical protein